LSYVYNRGNQWRDENLSQEATLQASLKYARKAVQLDDQLPEAHARLAWALIWNKQYEEGIRAAKRAIEIDPNYADGYLMIGHIMIYGDGSSEEAIELSKKGMQLDPYSTYHYLAHIADGYWMLGQSQEALATLKRSVKLEPDFMPGHLWLAAVQAELGQLEEARASIAEVQRLSPQTSIEGQRKVLPYKDTAVLERLLSALRKAGLPSVKPSEKR
jgi:adenylate cyclase